MRRAVRGYVGLNLLFGFTPGIDNAAHIGGLLTGAVLGPLLYLTIPSAPLGESDAPCPPGNLSHPSACQGDMERRKTDRKMEERDKVRPQSEQTIAYDLDTPLWSKYHREVRKNTRFPRYYKKSQNW